MQKRRFNWSSIKNLEIRNGTCHARVQIKRKEYWRSLHIDADPEGKNADVVREALRAFKLELAKENYSILQLTRSRDEYSTLSKIFAAYRAACKGRDIKEDTVKQNLDWMLLVVRTVKGESTDAEAQRASLFADDSLLRDFQSARIAAVKVRAAAEGWSEEQLEQRMKSTKNTVKSIIQQARSLFARELLQSTHYRGLVLPNLDAFMKFRAEGSTIAQYVPPPSHVWSRIVADLPELKTRSLAQWYAFWIGANSGLRRRSARNARWTWFTELADGSAQMHVRVAKGNNYIATIAPAVWTEMKASKSSTDYVIPLATDGEREAAIDGVVDYLRERGLTVEITQKPFHLLRKIYGAAMHAAHGLTEAQNALGHDSQDLTDSVYVEHKATKHVQVV